MLATVVIGHSNYLVREGLKSLIFNTKSLSFEGEASSGEELLKMISEVKPDVVILDHLDPQFGLAVVRRVVSDKQSKVLTISEWPTRWMLADALAAGVTSYLLRDCEKEEIVDAIISTYKKEQFFCGKIVSSVMKTTEESSDRNDNALCAGVKVSDRESEIIRYIAEGLTNKEIADKLHLSAHTVTTHRKNIMAKIGINNTAGLVMYAIRNNLVTPNHFLFNTN